MNVHNHTECVVQPNRTVALVAFLEKDLSRKFSFLTDDRKITSLSHLWA